MDSTTDGIDYRQLLAAVVNKYCKGQSATITASDYEAEYGITVEHSEDGSLIVANTIRLEFADQQ